MCCEVSHVIKLTNLTNNSFVPHELVLIKGIIRKPCSQKQIHLKTLNGHICQKASVSVVNGEFKILHCLQAGEEEFYISYCSESMHFKCQYIPPENPFKIQPLYIMCNGHDGSFNSSDTQSGTAAEACGIIDLNIKLLQCLYAEKLHESGFGRKTFSLKSKCQIFKSELGLEEAWSHPQDTLWNMFAYELINSEHGKDSKVKFVAFISCTKYEPITNGDYTYENIRRHMRANAALGGGGLALFGSAYFYSWPSKFKDILSCFENNVKVDLERFADDSNYRRTYGGVYATSLGAVCHEIGHIFDLGHTNEGVMGNGFDYVNRVFTIDRMTESLPNRVIGELEPPVKFTKVNREPNKFLEKYHEQKNGGDSFYFSRNCAILLAYHLWLRDDGREESCSLIDIDNDKLMVSTSSPLKLIEIRYSDNSLVVDFFEFTKEKPVHEFQLPPKWDYTKHYAFVVCEDGNNKRLDA